MHGEELSYRVKSHDQSSQLIQIEAALSKNNEALVIYEGSGTQSRRSSFDHKSIGTQNQPPLMANQTFATQKPNDTCNYGDDEPSFKTQSVDQYSNRGEMLYWNTDSTIDTRSHMHNGSRMVSWWHNYQVTSHV